MNEKIPKTNNFVENIQRILINKNLRTQLTKIIYVQLKRKIYLKIINVNPQWFELSISQRLQ